MNEQHKGPSGIGEIVESKEGERLQKPLCCNKANVRSPSLDVDAQVVICEEDTRAVLAPETINILGQFALTLKKIHIRLLMEGYVIKDGKIYKPGEFKYNEKNNDTKNQR